MESCADSNAGERELLILQGDAAKRDPPSEIMNSAEAEVHGGSKCTQLSVVFLSSVFSMLDNDRVGFRIIFSNETDAEADSILRCSF